MRVEERLCMTMVEDMIELCGMKLYGTRRALTQAPVLAVFLGVLSRAPRRPKTSQHTSILTSNLARFSLLVKWLGPGI